MAAAAAAVTAAARLRLSVVQRACLELASFSWTQSYRPCRRDIVLIDKLRSPAGNTAENIYYLVATR